MLIPISCPLIRLRSLHKVLCRGRFRSGLHLPAMPGRTSTFPGTSTWTGVRSTPSSRRRRSLQQHGAPQWGRKPGRVHNLLHLDVIRNSRALFIRLAMADSGRPTGTSTSKRTPRCLASSTCRIRPRRTRVDTEVYRAFLCASPTAGCLKSPGFYGSTRWSSTTLRGAGGGAREVKFLKRIHLWTG